MKVLVCHPGTQHAGKLAAALKRETLLGTYFTGLRLKPDSFLGRRLRLSALRSLDESLSDCTRQIRVPDLLAKALQYAGCSGERASRVGAAWFQKLIPDSAILSSNAVIGFDTLSWILARRAKALGRPFILERTAIHRATRASIRAAFAQSGSGALPESPSGGVQDAMESEEIALASRVVAASRFSERSLLDAGVAPEKISVIPYGVHWEWFAAGAKRGSQEGKLTFLFVGHVKAEKGIAILLDAWKRLAPSDAELCLAGSGDPETIAAARAIPGVRVLGKLAPEELRAIYRGASVFVFPTFYDGFGMVLLEAMACGLPILATPNCAAPELIRDGAAGAIFPAGDPAALCAAMADVCANRTAWSQRGVAAREIARSYSWEAYGERWAALLREVVS